MFIGKTPISLLEDPEWDMKSHPHLDPTGQNNLNCDRKVKLPAVQFFEQRIKNINPSFAQTSSFVFAALGNIQIRL